jgi:hypothetical protein
MCKLHTVWLFTIILPTGFYFTPLFILILLFHQSVQQWESMAVETFPTHPFRLLTVHSFSSLSYDRSKAPSKASSLHSAKLRASSFKWEYPHRSLKSSNSFLRLLPRLSVTFIPPFIFPAITRCRRQFLRKTWPIQFAFRLRISCRIFLYSLTLSNISLHDQSKWSFLSFSSTTFQNFPSVSDLLPEASKFQQRISYAPSVAFH